jgi:sucrose-6-phosphate hydrolase SacC (GH32 family)
MDPKPDVLLHYSPQTGIFGDPIPFFWNGEFHIYYQNSPGAFSFETMRWAHIVSKDLLHWEVLPDALIPKPASPDAYGCWTGSVMHWNNTFHIYYTGCAEPDGCDQTICHATSQDLIHWHKDIQNPILKPFQPFSTDSKSGWRDPCVIQDETGFRMLITAELAGKPRAFCGCIAELHSLDLEKWRFERVLYTPMDTNKMECPDLFKLDNRWILLYSNSGVQVRWSKNGHDHWEKTDPSYIDNFRFYAAKTLLDDQNRRLCFGFISDREQKNDSSPWKWGGILSYPRQLSIGRGNELIISAVDELKGMRSNPLTLEIDKSLYTLGKWQLDGKHLQGIAAGDQKGVTALVGQHPDSWEVSMQLNLEDCPTASLIFNCRKDYSSGYCLEINRSQAELTLRRFFPMVVSDSSLLQTFKLPNHFEKKVQLRVVLDHTLLEIYLNNTYSFSSRIYPQVSDANWWGLYSKCGLINAEYIEAWTLNLDNKEFN